MTHPPSGPSSPPPPPGPRDKTPTSTGARTRRLIVALELGLLAVGCAFVSAGLAGVWWGYGSASLPLFGLYLTGSLMLPGR